MVVLSLEEYSSLIDKLEMKLDEADKAANDTQLRYTHDEVFSKARKIANGK